LTYSIFNATKTCAIDGVGTGDNYQNAGDVGVYMVSGNKALLRRALATFDLFAAAAEGRPLRAGDIPNITLAELIGDAAGIAGPTFQVDTERLTRADYVNSEATWTNYKTGSAWTAAGGDVATPPADVSFTSPGTPGDQTLQNNLAGHVTDAIANRGGLLLLLWRAHDENPGVTAFYTTHAAPGYSPHLRLRVTYLDLIPAPIDEPGAAHGIVYGAASPHAAPANPAAPARPGRPQRPARGAHR